MHLWLRRFGSIGTMLALLLGSVAVIQASGSVPALAGGSSPLTWSSVQLTTGMEPLNSVACAPSGGLCVAVDNGGNIYTTTNPADASAGAWTLSASFPDTLYGVSCPSTSLCVAVDSVGDVISSSQPTSSWHSLNVDGSTGFIAISCPTTTFCAALDDNGDVLTTTKPTSTSASDWSVSSPVSSSLVAISCASASLCVAADGTTGDVYYSTNPTGGSSAWTGTSISSNPLHAIACPSSSFCLAGDIRGNTFTTTNPAGGVWTEQSGVTPGEIYSISCVQSLLCALGDNAGNTAVSSDPAAATPAWTLTAHAADPVQGISCPQIYLCVAVNNAFMVGDYILVGAAGQPTSVTFAPGVTTTSSGTTWTVTAKTSATGALGAAGTITLTAPTGTAFSSAPSDYTVNGTAVTSIAAGGGTSSVTLLVPSSVNIGDSTSFTVTAANTVNPADGSYPAADFAVNTSSDLEPANPASSVSITSSLSHVAFEATAATGGASTWTVWLTTSLEGALTGGSSTITVTAPAGTQFPSTPGEYTVNSNPVTAAITGGGTNSVTFTTPVNLGDNQHVYLTIANTANPSNANNVAAAYSVSTSADQAASPSAALTYMPDGAGALTISPSTVAPGSTDDFTLTYTAGSAGMDEGIVDIGFPSAFPAPTPISGQPGYVAVSGNSGLGFLSHGLDVIATLAPGAQVVIHYQNVTVPDMPATESFPTTEVSTEGGALTALAASPEVSVAFPVSSVTLSLDPVSVATGGTTTVSGAVYGASGATVPGASVNFSLARGDAGSTGILSASTATTDANGAFSTVLTAPGTPGAVTVTATVYGTTYQAQDIVVVVPGAVATAASNFAPISGCDVATATAAEVSATACGTGGLVVVQYSAIPSGISAPTNGAGYFDAAASAGNSFTSMIITKCNAQASDGLDWWNPGTSAWQGVSPAASVTFDAGTGCLQFTVGSATSPSLSEMDGTLFALTTNPPTPAPSTTYGGVVAPSSPVVTAISPATGSTGASVTITGTDLTAVTAVDFGNAPASSFAPEPDGAIVAIAPSGSGTVDVRIVTGAGTSAITPADRFTYLQADAVIFFSDVPPGYWAQAAIQSLAAKGIIDGFGDGTFRPNDPVTRAQFVKMLDLTLGIAPSEKPTAFRDVPAGAWYAGYVSAASQAGIVQGVSLSRFAPDAPLSREQMAVLVARALHLRPTGITIFKDGAEISPWAEASVQADVDAGYLRGMPDGSFQPLASATRAQAAEVLDAIPSRA